METLTSTETPVMAKTRELCETIVAQPGFKSMIEKIDTFTQNEDARSQYDQVLQKQELLQRKQEEGQQLTQEEIKDFEEDRDELLRNPIAHGFIEAQGEMREVQQSVMNYVSKTFELGRVPVEEDLQSSGCCGGGGGGGCGCSG